MIHSTLDVKNLNCPLPILKAKKALREVPVNALLEVLATDPGAEKDFIAFCANTGHQLIKNEQNNGVYRIVLRRSK